jgi:hypothetical protein
MLIPVKKLWGLVMGFTVWPFMFIVKTAASRENVNHEMIHFQQQKELLVIPAILLYVVEFLIKLVYYRFNTQKAYRNVSFEREAYENEINYDYLDQRKFWSVFKYVYVHNTK